MIQELFPILSTPRLERAVAFYRDALGGTVSYEFRGDDGSPVYIGLDLGSSSLGIAFEPRLVEAPRPRPISLWVYVADCDAVVECARTAGAPVIQEPTDEPWGERVARVRDPDGNDVIIGQRSGA